MAKSKIKDSPILWAVKQMKRRLGGLGLIAFCSALSSVLTVLFALGSKDVINCAVAGDWHGFVAAGIKVLVIILSILAAGIFSRHLHDKMLAELDRDWKRNLLHGILQGDYEKLASFHSGELLNRMNNDVRILDTGILSLIPNVVTIVTKLIAVMAVLLVMEPLLTGLVLVAGAVVIVITSFLRRRLKEIHKRAAEEEGKVSSFLQETAEKLLMVQAMDVSEEMENRADGLLESRYKVHIKRKNISLLTGSFVSVLSQGAAFFTLIYCAFRLFRGTMTYGEMTAVTQLVSQLRSPVLGLSGIMPTVASIGASAERLKELSDLTEQEQLSPVDGKRLYDEITGIGVRDLTFGYDRDLVFEKASFTLPKGSFSVIVGQSGIGKSTMLKLLLGIYRPLGGTLCATGNEEKPLDRSTRSLFAYVPQGNLLLSGTLRENLLLTNPEAGEEEIRRATFVSAMDEYLPGLPKGLDTVVGENAVGLSEGQAQRLSIARAVLADAPILLLDEATSALDAETEKTVLERLRALPGKTCIAVTHRPAALALADYRLEVKDAKCTVVVNNSPN